MAPCQPFMELEASGKDPLSNKCDDSEDPVGEANNEVDIDVIGCGNGSNLNLFDDPNVTENSSSFDNTDDDDCVGTSEGEVESQYLGCNGFQSSFDHFDRVFPMKKRKLTNHWRNYIRPVMWRCKWMELRMKELNMQVLKYTTELEAYDQGKHSELHQLSSEQLCSKSLPFSNQYTRKRAMKRRKRKRVEDTTDIASYMSQHNFFSYLENKRSELDNASCIDEFGNTVISDPNADCNNKLGTDEWVSFEYKAGDVSMEELLNKIETLHSRVKKLKGQIDSVISKNPEKFCSSDNLSALAPLEVQMSSAHSPTFSAGNVEEISAAPIYSSVQHLTEYDIGDMVFPGSVASSSGEAIVVPDIIESTVGLLSAADVTLRQPQFADSSEDIVENVLKQEEVVEGERLSFEMSHPKQEPDLWGQEDIKPCLVPSSSEQTDPTATNKLIALKSCLASDVNFPRNKRKRGERKAGGQVAWSKSCSGETEEQ